MTAQTANVMGYHMQIPNYKPFSTSQNQKDQKYSNVNEKEKVSNNLNKPFKLPILLISFDDDDDDDEETIHQKNAAQVKHSEFVESDVSGNADPCSDDTESEESEDESNYGYDTDNNSYDSGELEAAMEKMINSDTEFIEAMESVINKMEKNIQKT